MSRQSYSDSTAETSRRNTGHSTISAFSSSANPDEDWTKISNMAERRKIQNRIAQRNYRKKLKRRLEDLERRAESSSASPPQMPTGLQHQQDQKESVQYKKSPESIPHQSPPRILQNQHEPPMEDLMFGPSLEQEGSRTPPPFAYHTYSPYPQQPYRPVFPAGYRYGDCLAPVLSMMHFHETSKREEDTISPFNMSYPVFPATDLDVSHGYEDSNPHVKYNPESMPTALSHSSAPLTYSESGYQYPQKRGAMMRRYFLFGGSYETEFEALNTHSRVILRNLV